VSFTPRLRTAGVGRWPFPANGPCLAANGAANLLEVRGEAGDGWLRSRAVKTFKRAVLALVSVLVLAIAVGVPATVGIRPIIGARARPLTNRTFERTAARLERGRYLVTSAETPCILCHSPLDTGGGVLKVKNGMAFAGRSWEPDGLPFVTAPNLTSDPETGVGSWTDDQLARAIREGISHDGRTLFPAMPYGFYRHMSDEDLASIVVYLRSLPPIRNPLARTNVPFPLSRLIENLPQPVEAPVTPDLSTPEKRGQYIATLALCVDCHSPRDDRGNRVPGMAFSGGNTLVYADISAASANLTPSPNGIPYYTEDLFIETMRTGKVRARVLSEMMPTRYFRNFTDQDLKDVFAYLKTLEPVDHYVDNSLPPTPCPKCGLVHGGGERNRK
jgi:mono/diheme cytochrome c family protein